MKKLLLCTLSVLCTNFLNAQWQQTSCPNGGTFRCITSDGTNIFAANGNGAGIFLSTNNGGTWTAVNNGLTNVSDYSLLISGTNIFTGTNGSGVFLSTNNGSNWTQVNTGLTSFWVKALAINGTNIFAGTTGGVFLSTNNGANWSAVNNGLTNTSVFALATSGSNIFAATGGGVFLSTNNGTSWTAVNTGLSNLDVRALTISGTNIFAGTNLGGVFLSSNNGASWTAVNTGLLNLNVRALVINGTNIFAAVGGNNGIYMSSNTGSNWTQVNTGLTWMFDFYSLAVIGTNIFAGSNSGGIWNRPLSEMTAINEINSDYNQFSVYPNPNNGRFRIKIDNASSYKGNLEIFNLFGEKIFATTNIQQEAYSEIDLTKFSKGIYFVRFSDGSKSNTEKIVIE